MNGWLKIALPTAALLGAGTAVALASIPSASDNVIHACYPTTGTAVGQLRVVDADAGQGCTQGETTLTWNQTGPTGPAGPPGPPGDQGPSGDSGSGGGSFDSGSSGGSGGSGGTSNFSPTEAGGPAADIFVKLDGIPGDSTDDKHKGEIEAEAFAYGLKRTGKVDVPTVRIDKVYDSASPKLLAASISKRHIKSATITFRLQGGSSSGSTSDTTSGSDAFVTYKLSDVTVAGYEQGGANPDDKPLGSLEEEIALTAAKAQVTERTVDQDGNPGPVLNAGVSLKPEKVKTPTVP
jgi:type VI secretion system secreted protein Hcp